MASSGSSPSSPSKSAVRRCYAAAKAASGPAAKGNGTDRTAQAWKLSSGPVQAIRGTASSQNTGLPRAELAGNQHDDRGQKGRQHGQVCRRFAAKRNDTRFSAPVGRGHSKGGTGTERPGRSAGRWARTAA